MDKKEFEILVRERDAHIEKLIQAKRDVARLKKLQLRTLLQEQELLTAQKIVDDEPTEIAMLDERLAARQTSARAQNGPARLFPPPWSIEESAACFIVRDGDKQALAYVHFESERGRALKCEAAHARRGVSHRGEHRQAAKRAAADLEGHSAAAKFG